VAAVAADLAKAGADHFVQSHCCNWAAPATHRWLALPAMSANALSQELQGLLDRTGALLGELCDGRAAGASDAAVPGLFSAYQALRQRADTDQLTVAVLALAKAGERRQCGVGASSCRRRCWQRKP